MKGDQNDNLFADIFDSDSVICTDRDYICSVEDKHFGQQANVLDRRYTDLYFLVAGGDRHVNWSRCRTKNDMVWSYCIERRQK